VLLGVENAGPSVGNGGMHVVRDPTTLCVRCFDSGGDRDGSCCRARCGGDVECLYEFEVGGFVDGLEVES
jgi:hypothetical protein